jgi:hypothetical protein
LDLDLFAGGVIFHGRGFLSIIGQHGNAVFVIRNAENV